ncbi:mucin-2 [Anopheles gambiae]|uniref:mucin-2 n=1 Tax=Anopheles gambiae TaxID=7165 RepID=UPI002AC9781B|nr:mucin-2 [Anopheles gambiae]
MRPIVVCALVLLLVSPALARPNLVEPIYLRRRSNPLEIVEESVESGSVQPHDPSATTPSSSEQSSTGRTEAATTSAATTDGSTTSASTSTHQPSYAFKRPELLKTKLGTSGFVVSTSTKVLTGGASAASGASQTRPRPALLTGSGEAKAHDQLTLFDRFGGHAGVAEPMTDEEYQNELHRATERQPPRTTTPREGLSTWVLLSGSESSEMKGESTSTPRKPQVMTTTTTTTTTSTPKTTTKRFQPSTRRVMQTTPARPARTTTTTPSSVNSEEKKEKPNKPGPKQKIVSTTLKPVIVKKVKKPPTTTTTTTTTTPKPTTTTTIPTTTTTEMVITEQSASTVANDLLAAVTDDSSIESSTFLILEPKDAQFDLPEDRSPSKTAPAAGSKPAKKPSRKPAAKAPGKKKPANKKTRKPEVKDVLPGDKKPGNKNKPVSTQIINYLSREVMPTVGVGLVGLVMAAGLASYFLGSPLGALRRSDDRKDDLYYSNYEEYAGADGQNEEDVFGKLIAGMPDRSYYRNNAPVRRRTQVQPVRTGHQYYHVQPYAANKYPHITYRNRAYGGPAAGGPSASEPMYTNVNRPAQAQAQAKSQNEFFYNTPPTPHYPMRTVSAEAPMHQPAAPVYSSAASSQPATTIATTTTTAGSPPADTNFNTAAEPMVEPEHEMMPNPEAYSSEHSPEHHAQYVVGASYSDSMLDMINSAPVPEHGPRRKRRAVMEADGDEEEFENEIDVDEDRPKDDQTTSHPGEAAEMSLSEGSETTVGPSTSTTTEAHRYTWGDFIRNTVERKVAMGIHFLQHVTSDFQRYLNGVHDRFTVQQHHNHTGSGDTRRH